MADAWSISDSRIAFEHALQERGYWLARGDRRRVWDRLWGEHRRLTEQNAIEAQQAAERDQRERDQADFAQLEQRRQITLEATQQRLEAQRQQEELQRDRERYAQMVAEREAQAEAQRQAAQREQERQAQARAPPAALGPADMSAEFNRQAADHAARLEEFKQRREQEQ